MGKMDRGAKCLFISASASTPSRCEVVIDAIAQMLERDCLDLGHIRVRELPADALLRGDVQAPAIAEALRKIEAAQAIILVTPIYKGSYSGLLKAFIDLMPQYAMRGKYILPVAVGGSLAHMQMLDYSLRPVLQTMWPAHIGQGTFVLDQHVLMDKDKSPLAESALPLLRQALEAFETMVHHQLAQDHQPPQLAAGHA